MTSTIIILIAYFIVILAIGAYSVKFSKGTREDYYVASREFRTIILFAAVFGTNISALALIGAPGTAYHVGWVTWAYYVSSWAWLSPLLFYFVGSRVWLIGVKFNYITQSDVIGGRWNSNALRYLVAAVTLVYTVPYLMMGSIGGGRVLEGFTGGAVPFWLGALIVTAVVTLYVLLGGMRGTAWTNVVQTFIFLFGIGAIFFIVLGALGGSAALTANIWSDYPHLLTRERMPWHVFFGFGFVVSLAVPMFPQIFIRLFTGKSQKTLRNMSLMYPFAGFFVWFMVVYIGMWGKVAFPDLQGAASERIIVMLLMEYAPVWMTGVLSAAILAAAMSTMDAQLLTAGTLFANDVFKPLMLTKQKDNEVVKSNTLSQKELVLAKVLLVVLALSGYLLSLIRPGHLITLADWAFGGFAALFFPLVGAIYWKRCTKQAAIISILLSQVFLIGLPLGIIPKQIVFGMLPSFVAVLVSGISLVIATYLTKPAEADNTDAYFELFRSKKMISKSTDITS